MRPREKLLRRADYLRCYRTGRRRTGALVFLYFVPNLLGHARIGITATRKVGNAVVRHRLKRRIKEIYRRWPGRLGAPSDPAPPVAQAASGASVPQLIGGASVPQPGSGVQVSQLASGVQIAPLADGNSLPAPARGASVPPPGQVRSSSSSGASRPMLGAFDVVVHLKPEAKTSGFADLARDLVNQLEGVAGLRDGGARRRGA